MNPQDLTNEKLAVQATVTKFWKAYELKDLATTSKLLSKSGELRFFGTDSAEVIKSPAQWGVLIKNDWKLFDSTHFGEPRNVSNQVRRNGELASVVYEVPNDRGNFTRQFHAVSHSWQSGVLLGLTKEGFSPKLHERAVAA